MSVFKRSHFIFSFCGLVAVLLACHPTPSFSATASTSSVEVYGVPQTESVPDERTFPQGVIWNRPLKAGDLKLPRHQDNEKKKVQSTSQHPLPQKSVGGLKAPLLGGKGELVEETTNPPAIDAKNTSSTADMLMQGMKSILRRAGQNTDVPASGMMVTKDDAEGTAASVGKADDSVQSLSVTATAEDDGNYVSGQEPKAWVSPDKAGATSVKVHKDDIVFPPEMAKAKGTGYTGVDKATDLTVPPVPLYEADLDGQPKKTEEEETGFFDRLAKPFESVFGSSVEDEAEAKTAESAPAGAASSPSRESTPEAASPVLDSQSSECVPSVTKWTKDCKDIGYPVDYRGQVVGETRIECPSGAKRDIWLNNSCANIYAPVSKAASDTAMKDLTAPPTAALEDHAAVKAASSVPAVAEVAPVSIEASTNPVDASCGVANGLAVSVAPSADLCTKGRASALTGTGPWRWTCEGINGGMSISCAAPVTQEDEKQKANIDSAKASGQTEIQIEDGKCGAAAGQGTETPPVTDLCEKGAPSRVNGAGPWTWACSGLNGGAPAACTAQRKTNGECGRADKRGFDTMPMSDLCNAGYASAVSGEGPWNWTCSGLYGGEAATCSAMRKVDAVCGKASVNGARSAPEEGLCAVGSSTKVTGSGPWSWTCEGENGGASVACQALTLVDGQCGAAHGNQYLKAPTVGLCKTGRPSRVTGTGPWNWTCGGERGGMTESCTASVGTKESIANTVSCGKATDTLVLSKPSAGLCATGTASDVSGSGPWTWSCSDDAGHQVSCETLSKKDGACGKATKEPSAEEPIYDLCDTGTPGKAILVGDKWTWSCEGVFGGDKASCSAPKVDSDMSAAKGSNGAALSSAPQNMASAECGIAAGGSYKSKPLDNLCKSGEAGAVEGEGPWSWTCGDKKVMVKCEAQKLVDAICGRANGAILTAQPVEDLCQAGNATTVSGQGPWLWSCVGSGGGNSVSCSATSQAQTRVDGTCGSSANAVLTAGPTTNLCDSGMPSAVYGEGPWTWTCSGMNGGIASTCSASKVVSKAPPPPGPLVNGVCGSSNGVAFVSRPRAGFCSAGTPTEVSGDGPWNWACIGENGGMTVSCTAPLMPPPPVVGRCGGAHGAMAIEAPKSGLCSSGIASAVSGRGPWTWSCSGTNGGGAVSCVAPVGGSTSMPQPLPSSSTPSWQQPVPSAAPRDPVMKAPVTAPFAPAKPSSGSLVTPQLSASSLPPLERGAMPQVKPSKPVKEAAAKQSKSKKDSKPKAKVTKEEIEPAEDILSTPVVPDAPADIGGEVSSLKPPSVKQANASRPLDGLEDPIVDDSGVTVPGSQLVLEPDLATVSFDRGIEKVDEDSLDSLAKLAAILKANPKARITLIAYSDTGGDISPRQARRISLNRALSVRDYLAMKGVATSRVDVRPMGANVPSGDMDRVDIKIN
ncbi:MAG: hypothetical protein EOM37_00350 [Proteobacteria bacterium]|jgi:outer membrane protein OmpA-like peptidoglycan-associated protein|nr:OmpA family protein [Alphaproteobacteria bacterium]NCC02490.1 hypothetical protein [Pseudomonadota bacterium]